MSRSLRGLGRPYARFKSNTQLCIVSVYVRGVKCGGREAGWSVLIVCGRMKFKVGHGVGAVGRTSWGRSSPSAVELGRSCDLAGQGCLRARVSGSGWSIIRDLAHAV
jgi:hypothetical protein